MDTTKAMSHVVDAVVASDYMLVIGRNLDDLIATAKKEESVHGALHTVARDLSKDQALSLESLGKLKVCAVHISFYAPSFGPRGPFPPLWAPKH